MHGAYCSDFINVNKQNYPFCRLNNWLIGLDNSSLEPTNQKVLKVFLCNEKNDVVLKLWVPV